MNFIQEYALLIAVATPFFAVIGINVFLAFAGELETLLLPVPRPYPKVDIAVSTGPSTAGTVVAIATRPAEEERLREAA
jgi:hypothetical protein